MRVTLKDIVEKTGVSKSVVSMYLNKDPRVWLSDEKKKRIDAAVQELGYCPSRTACALRKGHTRLLGLVIGGITNPYFSHLAEACLIYADRRGYKVLISLASVWGAEKERECLETLIEQQVDGIIYAPIPVFDEAFCKKLEKTRIPLIHFSEQFDRFLSVRRNLGDAYDAAAAFLRSRGHKHVVKNEYAESHDLQFFKERAENVGLNTDFLGTHREKLAEILLKSRPSAIYCNSPDAIFLCDRIQNEAPEYRPDIIVDYYFPFDFVKDERIAGVVTGDFYARIRLAVDQLIARIENPDVEVSPYSYVYHTFYERNEFLKIKNKLPDTMEKSERKIL